MARSFVLIVIPIGLVPLRELGVGTRIRSLRRFPGATYSLPLPLGAGVDYGWFAARGAPVDPYRALLCRHRCQSSINTVTRHPAPDRPSTSGRVVLRIPCNHTPRPSDLPSAGANPAAGQDPQYPMVDPPKATKGRRMSKKTRKKSSKGPQRIQPPKAARRRRPARLQSLGQNARGKSQQDGRKQGAAKPPKL